MYTFIHSYIQMNLYPKHIHEKKYLKKKYYIYVNNDQNETLQCIRFHVLKNKIYFYNILYIVSSGDRLGLKRTTKIVKTHKTEINILDESPTIEITCNVCISMSPNISYSVDDKFFNIIINNCNNYSWKIYITCRIYDV